MGLNQKEIHMEQKSKYEIEIENFRKIFDDKKNMCIAIYGIGRRTATLLPGITDYNITGLLDRDKNNVGKELCDIKVIPIDNIEEKADLIIINSDPSNYEIIFKRISGKVTIPVYYADGRLACLSDKDKSYEQNEYWKSSYEELKDKIDQADIVSFDIFDTLIMRKIFSPEDVFRLLGEKIKAELKLDCNITGIRAQVAAKCGPFATINEIYEKIKKQIDLTDKNISDIMQLEKKTDMDLCIARKDIAELYEYCIESGKEVYLISDMYYTLQDIKRLLDKCGLSVIDDRHIWISCEKKKDKISGSLWKEYSSVVGKNAKCIHIGDNKIGDIENSKKYGINSYYVMSGKDMLMNSSLSELAANVNTVSDSICLGLVIAKLFNSPFALCSTNGKVSYDDSEIYGYCVYGPLLEKFLIWLYYNSRKDGIDKLLFFARDGYFLEKDYKIVSELLNDGYKQDWCYLPISRRLIYMATMKSEDDLKRVVAFPYVGTFADYMKSRFEITVTDATAEYNDRQINAVGDSQNILNWIQPYKDKIMEQAKRERENYLDYLKSDGDMQAGLSYGTVDVGYYGTNQYYLQRLTGIKTKGYCFYSCLSNKNEYVKYISMKGCFQYDKDYDADESLIRKKAIYVETFITAPNGMAKYIDEENNVVCENNKKSQQYFSIKETVNNGVVKFILDYLKYVEKNSLCNNCTRSMKNRKISIEDMIFDVSLKGKTNISEDICLGFWWDNDYVGKRELKIEI
jgi:predicted HAD superfamily hydrolase